ncbi:unnamed protein product [Parajaminaea phylloscopi]
MPPVLGISAPKCPRCGKSVYIAEQVIGPNSTPYHKPCLTCVACNKRLDSTLLVEHDGQPLCHNCHRSHLGPGKGGFSKAVPVRATLPNSPPKSTAPLPSSDDELVRRVTGISITARSPPRQAPSHESRTGFPNDEALSKASSRTVPDLTAQSLDDMVSAESPGRNVGSRNATMTRHVQNVIQAAGGTTQSELGQGPGPDASSSPSRRTVPDQPQGAESALTDAKQCPTDATRSLASSSTAPAIGGFSSPSASARGLPPPVRRTPTSTPAGSYKTASGDLASPRSPSALPRNSHTPSISSPFRSQYISPTTTPTRLSNAIGSGTPLCARCSKPAYFAEAVQGATTGGRVWHRPCLKCESCGTTLRKGTLEEGPPEEAASHGEGMNTFCKLCYRKHFGPRGIGSAGMSFPTTSR